KRLAERGIVENSGSVVRSLVGRDEIGEAEIAELVDSRFDGSVPAFVAAFARNRRLTEKDIDELQSMINRMREGL
ncbi:MAG: BlaI/MecI/CopY family transcriptional regulator, partial [Oscillospiraceae bacterium]|nr:BlaI/MecI/CopY family transcriptional regulator [Oscillospiraceae bacterium]